MRKLSMLENFGHSKWTFGLPMSDMVTSVMLRNR